jgi:hypothetical protein
MLSFKKIKKEFLLTQYIKKRNPTDHKSVGFLFITGFSNYKFVPPETSMRCALTQRASSVHKKATTPPISSGKPTLPNAVKEAIC